MVHLVSHLALAASIASFVIAAPAPDPFVTIPVAKGTSGNSFTAKDVVERDQGRIAHYNGRTFEKRTSSGIGFNQDVSYIAVVNICTQSFKLIVDTGSSNLWAGAGSTKPSTCGVAAGGTFSVRYGSGSVSGTERTGPVSYAGLTVAKQSFGSASSASGFRGVDGIIGFGPVGLTQGTVSGLSTVPTFMNNLKSAGIIAAEVLGVYFAPEIGSDTDDANGELTLGGVDTRKYTGTLTYFPKSTTYPYSFYWGITTAGLTYGSTLLQGSANAIVDTGTTLLYIPTSAYSTFLRVAGGVTDSYSGFARFSTKPTGNFIMKIGLVNYPLTPAQYLVPLAQYAHFGLSSSYYYSWINNGGTNAANVNFIIGQKFLENYYSVYDTTNSRIGFATRT
ncbi:putative aspartic protease [Clavulina sp. PMI_390]|nr:putative aspartic protease [Clavulina sp. PMI_390]